MRIAMMTNNYKPFVAGVPVSIERLSDGLRKLGHEVVIFAPTYRNQTEEPHIVRYHSLVKGIYGGFSIPFPIDLKIEEAFRKERFDIIHVHHPMVIGRTAIYLSKKYEIPLVFTYHTRYEQYIHYCIPNNLLRYQMVIHNTENIVEKYLQHFFQNCNHIFAPTDGIKDYLIQSCGYSNQKVSVLATGISQESFSIDEEKINRIRKTYNAEQCSLFISVSRIAKEKNIAFLLECMNAYKKKSKRPFKLLLIGDGPDLINLKEKSKELELEDNIIFTGKIDNNKLKDYYGASDAFVFASKSETQGIVLLEAFAAGTPVICVNATGVSDLVKDGKNGYLVNESIEEFSDCMLHMEMTQNKKELKEYAIRTALSFDECSVAKEALKQYNEVILDYRRKYTQKSRGVEKWKATSIVS